MVCLYPVYVSVKGVHVLVPCGKCVECEKSKRREWYVRLLSELGECDYSKFATLTYDDDHIPNNEELQHGDFQLYVKRLRKSLLGIGVRIKYYMCGEYGGLGGRPHYHVLVFFYGSVDDGVDLSLYLKKFWDIGILHVGTVTPRSIMYCLGYLKKQLDSHSDGRKRPYQKMSHGIGVDYCRMNELQLSSKNFIEIKGYKYAIPRYFRTKSEAIKISHEENSLSSEDYARYVKELESNYKANTYKIVEDCNGEFSYELVKSGKNLQRELNVLQKSLIKRGSLLTPSQSKRKRGSV